MSSTKAKSKSNAGVIIAAVLGTLVFSVVTYVTVDIAGGVDVGPEYSNTPNGVVPGPPEFK